MEKFTIGWEDWAALPKLGLPAIKIKTDTGVDIIRTDHGPKVLEVNSSPGLEGIEKTTAVNVAQNIIKLIEQNVRSLKSIKK